MIRSNIEMPRVPKDWLDGASENEKPPANEQPLSGWPAHWTMMVQRTD